MGVVGMKARTEAWHRTGPSTDLKARVRSLEGNFQRLIEGVQQDCDEHAREVEVLKTQLAQNRPLA